MEDKQAAELIGSWFAGIDSNVKESVAIAILRYAQMDPLHNSRTPVSDLCGILKDHDKISMLVDCITATVIGILRPSDLDPCGTIPFTEYLDRLIERGDLRAEEWRGRAGDTDYQKALNRYDALVHVKESWYQVLYDELFHYNN